MTPLEIRIGHLWNQHKNTAEIAETLKMKECEVYNMRPSHLGHLLGRDLTSRVFG